MKTKLFFLLCLLISGNTFSSGLDTIKINSKIKDVTVYFTGAQITRQADVNIRQGKSLIVFDRLPQEINTQSIQVNNIDKCKILSVKHELVYQSEKQKEKEELEILNQIEAQEFKIKLIKNQQQVYELEERLLLDNSLLAKNEGGSAIADIKEAAEFYRSKLNEIRKGKLDLFTELDAANKKITELFIHLNKLTAENRKTHSQIMIALDCELAQNTEVGISYYISSAGWEPLYDFRVEDIDKPLVIVYNANVYQSSGEDWNNVNIKLSTSNPSLSGQKPELITWHIDKKYPYKRDIAKEGPATLSGRITENLTNEPLPFANVLVLNNKNEVIAGTISSSDGQYTIKPIPSGRYNIKVDYIGFQSVKAININLPKDMITYYDFSLLASSIELSEVMIVEEKSRIRREEIAQMPARNLGNYRDDMSPNIRGSRSDGTEYYVDGVIFRGNLSLPQSAIETETIQHLSYALNTNVVQLEYSIEIPYTIPSNGQDYNLKIQETSLSANYVYYAVPRLENDVFLTAEITDWTKLNLLSGKSSIYYQGNFTGESFIDADQIGDTLVVSLGRDRNILVTNEYNRDMHDKRIIGNNIRETIGWDINIRNNKNSKIKIKVIDQYPISERRSISVDLINASGAKTDDLTGNLSWELELNPNETKKLTYKYSVRYPRTMRIVTE